MLRCCATTVWLVVCAALTAQAQSPSPDRVVAEWMLRMGGSVVLEGQHRAISDLAELPASDFQIRTLNFTGITQWAFALEDELRRLPPPKHGPAAHVNRQVGHRPPILPV